MYKKCEDILRKLESEGKIKISNYQFPPKQELKLKLKDMLEDEVDEKYYLSDEWVKKIKYEYENNTICETRYDEGIRTFKDNICGSLRTIDACGNKCVIQVKNATKIRIRKLTPKECWRLMGFEDKDFEKASKVNSNTQLYKQAGNSIVVNVLEAILTNLLIDNKQEITGQTNIYDFIGE